MRRAQKGTLELQTVDQRSEAPGIDILQLQTNAGVIRTRYHFENGAVVNHKAAVIWMGGAGGGLSGPAAGMYPRLAKQLVVEGVDSLRLDYRRPNHLSACVLDTLIGAAYLQKLGYRRLVLVGHSFGGAVVITAGAQLSGVVGIVCLASQNAGTELAHELSPRAILLLHGEADGVLNAYCSQDIYMRSREPRQLILYPGCGHGFDECRNEADRDILRWIREQVQRTNPT